MEGTRGIPSENLAELGTDGRLPPLGTIGAEEGGIAAPGGGGEKYDYEGYPG